jgi:hypothetical protein
MSDGGGVEMCGSVRFRIGWMGRWGAGGCRGWVDGARTGLEMEAEGVRHATTRTSGGNPPSMSVTAKYCLDLLFYNTCFFFW